jgi:fructose-1,6-bisphosphatase/sedoheptulose 1,7-bisphosphatase-like protein
MSDPVDRCLCTELVSVTERSALALGRSLGRGDPARALDEGLQGIREGLALVPLSGRIAIGIDGHLPVDTMVGAGGRQ